MKFRPIVVDDNQQELTQHGTADFPMSMDRQLVSSEGCMLIPHWHYEIQISVVVSGTVCFRTPIGDTLLQEGEGIFINSAVLHEIIPTGGTQGVYVCVNFHPNLIYGQSDSMIRRDYVEPMLSNPALQAIALQDEPWHKEICGLMRALTSLNEEKPYGYELMEKSILERIWYIILSQNRSEVEKESPITFGDRQRMKQLQAFIQKNYMERITLADIANAGHISRGECCRFFQRILKTSPMVYLTKYRLSQSIKLLACTNLSISQIALQTGFSTSSYYSECFREETGATPLKYRKQHQHEAVTADKQA